MKYIDQHMHTYFSFDSEEQFESYLELTDGPIVTTEHLDLNTPTLNFEDVPLDLEGYMKKVDALNKKYNNRILKGIEVGFTLNNYHRILKVLDTYEFDLVLLSVHYNDAYDYMDRRVDYDKTPSVLIPEYLERLITAVKTMGDRAQVLTHFDYGFRISDISQEDLKKYGESKLLELFDVMKEKNLSFEINARSLFPNGNQHLYQYVVPLYVKHGGTEITLGSDSHSAKDYQLGFKDLIKWLDTLGVKYINQYINQKAQRVFIKDLLED